MTRIVPTSTYERLYRAVRRYLEASKPKRTAEIVDNADRWRREIDDSRRELELAAQAVEAYG